MTRFGKWPERIQPWPRCGSCATRWAKCGCSLTWLCGSDGRNRCLLSPFRSITGRNQPSNARFIFGPSCWLRSLIQPEPGRAVAYVDW